MLHIQKMSPLQAASYRRSQSPCRQIHSYQIVVFCLKKSPFVASVPCLFLHPVAFSNKISCPGYHQLKGATGGGGSQSVINSPKICWQRSAVSWEFS